MTIKTIAALAALTASCMAMPALGSSNVEPTWSMYKKALTEGVDLQGYLDGLINSAASHSSDVSDSPEAVCTRAAASKDPIANRECLIRTVPMFVTDYMGQEVLEKLLSDPDQMEVMNKSAALWAPPLGNLLSWLDRLTVVTQKIKTTAGKPPTSSELEADIAMNMDRGVAHYADWYFQSGENPEFERYNVEFGPEGEMIVFRDGEPYIGAGYVGGRLIGSPVTADEIRR